MFFFCLIFKDNLSNLLNFFPSVQTCGEIKVFSGECVRLREKRNLEVLSWQKIFFHKFFFKKCPHSPFTFSLPYLVHKILLTHKTSS